MSFFHFSGIFAIFADQPNNPYYIYGRKEDTTAGERSQGAQAGRGVSAAAVSVV